MSQIMNIFIDKLAPAFNPLGNVRNEDESDSILIPMQNAILKEIIEVDERLYVIPFPAKDKIGELSKYFNAKFGNNYLVYNLSEHKYQSELFRNQVIEYLFPGYPCAPLDVLFMICKEIEAWLKLDYKNVAVVHCQSSKGRSAMILAAYMTYSGREYFHPAEALNYYCNIIGVEDEMILVPSQKRYLNYMGDIINGFFPKYNPMILERLIMNGIPNIGCCIEDPNQQEENPNPIYCRPYLQIFKHGSLIYSSLDQNPNMVDCLYEGDLSYSFNIGIEVDNDILIRMRHYHNNTERVSMLRLFFHSSFIVENYMRLSKEQIDGAKGNDRFPDDFFIDLAFSTIPQNEIDQQSPNNKDNMWTSIYSICQKKVKVKTKYQHEKVSQEIQHLKKLAADAQLSPESPNHTVEEIKFNNPSLIKKEIQKKKQNALNLQKILQQEDPDLFTIDDEKEETKITETKINLPTTPPQTTPEIAPEIQNIGAASLLSQNPDSKKNTKSSASVSEEESVDDDEESEEGEEEDKDLENYLKNLESV